MAAILDEAWLLSRGYRIEGDRAVKVTEDTTPLVPTLEPPTFRVLEPAHALMPDPRVGKALKKRACWPYKSEAEQRYAQLLDTLKYEEQIAQWWYEPMKGLYLAPDTSYTPDFLVQWLQGPRSAELEIHEVKGAHIREKDWIKAKTAANKYPCFRWILAQWKQESWYYKDIPRH